jgi:hypothetical protein
VDRIGGGVRLVGGIVAVGGVVLGASGIVRSGIGS